MGQRGQSLEVVGFVKTGGFVHSWVVLFGSKTAFVSVTDNRSYDLFCADKNTKSS